MGLIGYGVKAGNVGDGKALAGAKLTSVWSCIAGV